MQTFETEHYTFHYGANTPAERDIEKIAALQEGCFSHTCRTASMPCITTPSSASASTRTRTSSALSGTVRSVLP